MLIMVIMCLKVVKIKLLLLKNLLLYHKSVFCQALKQYIREQKHVVKTRASFGDFVRWNTYVVHNVGSTQIRDQYEPVRR